MLARISKSEAHVRYPFGAGSRGGRPPCAEAAAASSSLTSSLFLSASAAFESISGGGGTTSLQFLLLGRGRGRYAPKLVLRPSMSAFHQKFKFVPTISPPVVYPSPPSDLASSYEDIVPRIYLPSLIYYNVTLLLCIARSKLKTLIKSVQPACPSQKASNKTIHGNKNEIYITLNFIYSLL